MEKYVINIGRQLGTIAGTGTEVAVQLDLMTFGTGIDHDFDHGAGVAYGVFNTVGIQIVLRDVLHEDLVGVDILCGGLGQGVHGFKEVTRDGLDVDGLVLRRYDRLVVQGVEGVADQGSLEVDVRQSLLHVRVRRGRRDLAGSGAQEVGTVLALDRTI